MYIYIQKTVFFMLLRIKSRTCGFILARPIALNLPLNSCFEFNFWRCLKFLKKKILKKKRQMM